MKRFILSILFLISFYCVSAQSTFKISFTTIESFLSQKYSYEKIKNTIQPTYTFVKDDMSFNVLYICVYFIQRLFNHIICEFIFFIVNSSNLVL